MANTKDQTASPGTHIPGPLYIEGDDPALDTFGPIPDQIVDAANGVTASPWQLDDVGVAFDQDLLNANFSLLTYVLNGILDRIKAAE